MVRTSARKAAGRGSDTRTAAYSNVNPPNTTSGQVRAGRDTGCSGDSTFKTDRGTAVTVGLGCGGFVGCWIAAVVTIGVGVQVAVGVAVGRKTAAGVHVCLICGSMEGMRISPVVLAQLSKMSHTTAVTI